MNTTGAILFTVLDTLIKVLLPIVAGYAINYFNKKIGHEKFMLAREIVTSIVKSLEQQYRSGEIPKDDRFALAMEQGIKRTGLSEDLVAQLIKDAVFQMNTALNKYDYTANTAGFALNGQSDSVSTTLEQTTPVVAEDSEGLADKLLLPPTTV